jgi:acyl carrier protein
MTETEVFEKLRAMLVEVLGVRQEQVQMDSVLVEDLGAESIDLLDLSFLIEQKFGVTLEPDEFEKEARKRIPGGQYEQAGHLTQEALEALRQAMPEVPPDRFRQGFRKVDVPALLTVRVFVHLIQRKLNGGEKR